MRPRSTSAVVDVMISIPTLPTASLQLIQMLQPRQDHLLTRLLNLPCQKDLIENRINLVEIEHEIQLTHVPEELIQHLDEEMYGLQVRELVVVGVDAHAEEQPCVTAVDDLCGGEVLAHEGRAVRSVMGGGGGGAELDEVRLVFLVAGGDESVDLGRRLGAALV